MKTIEELRARLAEIKKRLSEIDTEFAGKRFSAEAKAEWNSLQSEREDVKSTVAELEVRMAQLERVSADDDALEAPARNMGGEQKRRAGSAIPDDVYDLSEYRSRASSPERENQLLRDGAMRAIEDAHFEHPDANREDTQGHVARVLDRLSQADNGETARRILSTGSPLYKRAFAKALVGRPLDDSETRALALGGSAAYAVPFTLDPTIIPTSNGVVNPLRAMSRVESITTDKWKGVTSGGVSASYVAEGTEATDGAPTLTQPEVKAERAQAFVPYSIEIGADWGGLLAELSREFQDAKDALEATKLLSGNGSDEPYGLLDGITTTVAAGTAAFTIAHLYALSEAVPPRFEPNASFLAHNAIYNRVRQFDTQGGANLWEYLANETPDRLLGKPAFKASTMASTLTAGNQIMVYGDFRQFLIVDRIGMSVEVIPHLFGTTANLPTGQRGAFAYWRNGSKVLVPGAFRALETT